MKLQFLLVSLLWLTPVPLQAKDIIDDVELLVQSRSNGPLEVTPGYIEYPNDKDPSEAYICYQQKMGLKGRLGRTQEVRKRLSIEAAQKYRPLCKSLPKAGRVVEYKAGAANTLSVIEKALITITADKPFPDEKAQLNNHPETKLSRFSNFQFSNSARTPGSLEVNLYSSSTPFYLLNIDDKYNATLVSAPELLDYLVGKTSTLRTYKASLTSFHLPMVSRPFDNLFREWDRIQIKLRSQNSPDPDQNEWAKLTKSEKEAVNQHGAWLEGFGRAAKLVFSPGPSISVPAGRLAALPDDPRASRFHKLRYFILNSGCEGSTEQLGLQ